MMVGDDTPISTDYPKAEGNGRFPEGTWFISGNG